MPFLGELKQATAYTINVDNGLISSGKTAITVLKINRRENIAAAETELVIAGARVSINGTAGPRIDRVIISVHPPRNTTSNVEVVQGVNSFTQACVGDTDLVFEAIP